MTPRILIVENDPQYGRWLRHHVGTLWPEGDPVACDFAGLESRLATLGNGEFDLIILGAPFAAKPTDDAAGFDWLRKLRKVPSAPPVVVVAAGGSERSAVKAIRLGASDYQPRDSLNAASLEYSLRHALQRSAAHSRRQLQLQRRRQRRARRMNAPPDLSVATREVIPHYSLLHVIGESARATVWLARSAALGKTVALKISKPGTADEGDQQLFAREYAAIAALRHPAIVDIYDYGVFQHYEYLAMEYFPCGDLKQRLQNPITPAQSMEYLQRIAEALQVVHATGMLHRDLKPPNIMLREDRSIVLIDFGLAKRVGSNSSNTAIGVLRGSPYYMSPEQVRGLPLDARSDLYSLGVIFYEMLTGRKPYVGNSAIELMEQHVAGRRAPLPPPLAHLEALLAPLMTIERDDRFPDAAAVVEAIALLTANATPASADEGLAHAG